MFNPFSLIIDFCVDFIKRRRHFTFEEWMGWKDKKDTKRQGLIDKCVEVKAKSIKTSNMEITFLEEKEKKNV